MKHDKRCPHCGRFVDFDGDGFYDCAEKNQDPEECWIAQFCNETCADMYHGRTVAKSQRVTLTDNRRIKCLKTYIRK